MSILTLAGSPSQRSRSSALLRHAAHLLRARGLAIAELGLRDLPAEDLIEGHYAGPAANALRARVAAVDAVLISTPVYKASFSGGLKAVLDLLDEKALAGKVVLPIATGGSPAHLLALEYGLKPVLSALGARHILAGVYATDKQVRVDDDGASHIDDDVRTRLEDSVERLAEQLRPRGVVVNEAFDLGRLALAGGFSV
ncbi:NADPH-dependent FMN reductase [Achromobacter xylosoxidans]|jgi:FMN reductase|uniref:FMN reductase (NADPH) n=1 Tax=Alcaligenes xylosoxydans xylosoxydans TaxID=85698 RepID=A0A0D6FKB0_ALCXX|nr:NADPH-dependent FMN reductase [Achromobacter xylosoxidans]AHC44797.1 FMN reductase [Achromobacter xylosoxidans NBRC 15126 = ATCC 27061]AUZ19294.1 FMN reductase (NADPH) [Achromobacter xylosoxidans]EFV84480.1 FMN reductase [Achromobacter xylosoxidans C54]KAA5919894.1 NADPH-dependent FMN reductase [Achromobacter xylosoxidans]KMJ88656.1 NADPH-dependent FMN reductase [Achromobacter xylosoxidans]